MVQFQAAEARCVGCFFIAYTLFASYLPSLTRSPDKSDQLLRLEAWNHEAKDGFDTCCPESKIELRRKGLKIEAFWQETLPSSTLRRFLVLGNFKQFGHGPMKFSHPQ